MWKKYKVAIVISVLISLLPMVFGFIMWDKLPDQIPIHFGMNNSPDGYSSKVFAVVGLPLIISGAEILGLFFTFIDPKKANIGPKAIYGLLMVIPLVSVFCSVLTYGYALGISFNVQSWASVLLGVVFIIMGNIMPKAKRNYSFGIKVPWALNDEENWNATNRFGAFVFVIGGILILITGLIKSPWPLFLILILMVLLPTAYSYIYYLKHRREEENE